MILSGGASLRFGGVDKGLQIYREKPLIEWVIAAIEPQVRELVLCINRNKPEYEKFGHRIVFDHSPDHQGPIAGILAAIDYLETSSRIEHFDQLLVSSCDSPALPCDYVQPMIDQLDESGALVAVVNDGNRNQNMHCLIRRNAWNPLRNFYAEGGRAMYQWFRQSSLIEVNFTEQADCFLNVNSPDQLNSSHNPS